MADLILQSEQIRSVSTSQKPIQSSSEHHPKLSRAHRVMLVLFAILSSLLGLRFVITMVEPSTLSQLGTLELLGIVLCFAMPLMMFCALVYERSQRKKMIRAQETQSNIPNENHTREMTCSKMNQHSPSVGRVIQAACVNQELIYPRTLQVPAGGLQRSERPMRVPAEQRAAALAKEKGR